jgi:hypothetical protein
MSSQGSAHARFQRAITRGRLLNAEMAARQLGTLSLADALALVLLYQRAGDDKVERAARRWVRRVQIDRSLRHQEVELLRAAIDELGRASIAWRSMRFLRQSGTCTTAAHAPVVPWDRA